MKHGIGLTSLLVAVAGVILVGYWIQANYVPRAEGKQPSGPFRIPGYRQMAENALREFSNLPTAEQSALRRNLDKNIVSVASWLDRVGESGVQVLCLGENHADATRQFLARTLFSELDVDALLLEVTPHRLEQITQELGWGKERVPLLGADIADVIRTVRKRNPDIELIGIEETQAQRISRQAIDRRSPRDESIENNFWQSFRYGSRQVILLGALHCTNREQWFYGGIRRLAPSRVANEMLNVRVVAEHQDGPVEAFVYFLRKIGIPRNDFVIVGSQALPPLVREWFDLLNLVLEDFDVLIVFRSRLQESDG
ncbi:MAG: hypothetical protein BMS9Abin14_624 [Gammaproteobacteria bacterium]|nr:MAG: hypothetical protein BMS9Abin14_624 [Gammaproteobacteria bacterium]